jgi:hypothetical protein
VFPAQLMITVPTAVPGVLKMNKQFIQVTNGMLPVAMLALLAVAFIAGQARANLPSEVAAASAPTVISNASILFSVEALKKAESLPHVLDAILSIPNEVELTIQLRGKASKTNRAGSSHQRLRETICAQSSRKAACSDATIIGGSHIL